MKPTAPEKPKAKIRKHEFAVIGVDPRGRPAIMHCAVKANTRSEARAVLKTELGIPAKAGSRSGLDRTNTTKTLFVARPWALHRRTNPTPRIAGPIHTFTL